MAAASRHFVDQLDDGDIQRLELMRALQFTGYGAGLYL
ncbi:hypothetical protein HNQ51_002082 [Inhella inkyongensis]|uniref:Uncharacterized protein n=1 Tax=Inhella inkyongensis TaxID=392593 RepID=A0A840S5K3_9BURK|nr:hypothetical protein [Inhella inkyongensis]